MVTLRTALFGSLSALIILLSVLWESSSIGAVGWVSGLACGVALSVALAQHAQGRGVASCGPADLVTLSRAVLSCGVAALVAESFVNDVPVRTLVAGAATALLLDAVDGQVARRSGTVSRFGAGLDGEADAFLMLVLSVYVAASVGAWVLAIGALRYAFAVAGRLLPWMRAELPPRYWRKVVTATAGVALTCGAAALPVPAATYSALVVALGLLAESFGRDVWWLWRQRSRPPATRAAPQSGPVRLPLP